MRGYYNVSFTGACADALIVACEYNGVRWTRNGLWVTIYGCNRETLEFVMEVAQEYKTF
jgi:hypothetical protein